MAFQLVPLMTPSRKHRDPTKMYLASEKPPKLLQPFTNSNGQPG
eukprot:CAMPEP_0181518872 /NCGR_PEP_ID=MMETSP1110-20121109/65489_1 /TAXON_ID=174948 /ORGANISM="Symbiodinium sp., Strain CCMP421" /LENGTH=43 /DNA_ID= /DNA_START= /DNA_END= /DNA_ORIENTATION=